jgi:hypothetical protein
LAILDVETPGRQGVKTQENPNIAAQQVDYFLNGSQWGLHKKPSLKLIYTFRLSKLMGPPPFSNLVGVNRCN